MSPKPGTKKFDRDKASRMEIVRHIYREHRDDHPMDKLWEWAEAGKDARERAKRWETLSDFARKHRNEADDKDSRDMWDFRAETYRKKYRYCKKVVDRRAKKRADDKDDGPIVYFDGKPVTRDWAEVLQKCRATGLWNGSLTSGWRDPEYSEQLCYTICNAPTCSGRCAGRYSNHSKDSIKAGAAVDVSDPLGFRSALIRIGRSELHNALGAADPWHFSITGR